MAPEISEYRHEGKGFKFWYPLYNGEWKRSLPYIHEGMATDDMDEPHLKRKHAILENHPEIVNLYGPDSTTIYLIFASTAAQMWMAYLFGRVLIGWNLTFLFSAYFIGGTLSALFGCLIHELAHNLVSPIPLVNRLLALVINTGLPFPISASFRRYHLIHHAYQGVDEKDPDLPMAWEYRFIKGNSLMKLLWVFCYAGLYVIRGIAMFKPLTFWEYANIAYVLAVDFLEHYTFEDGQETYSYYGILNKLFINIGYHTEHHDFMQIPWSRLPQIKQLAPEFYDGLSCHTSWVWMHFKFIFSNQLGPQSRVKRTYADHSKSRKSLTGKLRKSQ
ncbi:sphingolipid delta-4 desaturase [Massospora cicadina]|nr:sphingolipid delta-4 desaturase [Massospora cicadina]